jgi:uncharacterized protein (TIGR02118 family)
MQPPSTDRERIARTLAGTGSDHPGDQSRPLSGEAANCVLPEDREDDTVIRMSVYYPKTEGATFDHDYYCDRHVPLAVKTWGLDGAEIDKGIDGPYVAAVHFKFASLEALNAALGAPGTQDVMADVANYTTITPVLQTSEVVE